MSRGWRLTRARLKATLPFLAGAATALAGARLFAGRPGLPMGAREDPRFAEASGRGAHQAPPSGASTVAGYETGDASARKIAWAIAIFAGTAMAAIGLMVVLLSSLHGRDADRIASLTHEQRSTEIVPLPHLQADPMGELAALRARQASKLDGYARIDPATARIPIGRAMALVVGQSLDAHALPQQGHRP